MGFSIKCEAKMVAVVVPSPAVSLVFWAACGANVRV